MARLRVCFNAIHKLAHGVGVKVGWVECNETHHPKMRVKRKRLA